MEHEVEKMVVVRLRLSDKETKALASCLQHVNFDVSQLTAERRQELTTFKNNLQNVLIEATD
jgi:hypothetical protein